MLAHTNEHPGVIEDAAAGNQAEDDVELAVLYDRRWGVDAVVRGTKLVVRSEGDDGAEQPKQRKDGAHDERPTMEPEEDAGVGTMDTCTTIGPRTPQNNTTAISVRARMIGLIVTHSYSKQIEHKPCR